MSKYLKTKEGSIESAVLEAMSPAQQAAIAISKKEKEQKENNYIHAAKMAKEKGEKTFTIGGKEYDVEEALATETNKNDKSDDGDGMDAVQPKAVKKKFADRKDKDIDNDGDVDDSDKFLHKRRKAVSKSINKEEVELDEIKQGWALIDTADGNKVKALSSREQGVKQSRTSAERPPMSVKDKNTLKIVKLKKAVGDKQASRMIGYPLEEEVDLDENKKADLAKKLAKASQASKKGKSKVTLKKAPWDKKEEADKPKVDNRPDSAKDVDAARDDKKKTRIAQLQLQIAKATETINKLNTQEK